MIIYDKKSTNKKKITKSPNKEINLKQLFPIFIAVIAIICVIIFYIYNQKKENYSNIKIYQDEPIVMTRYDNNNSKYPIIVPFINIDNDTVESLNTEILNYSQEYAKKKKNAITYEYEINGDIISLVVKAINNNTGEAPRAEYRTYNFNLETLKQISDDELLELFGQDYKTVEKIIENKLKYYYADEVKTGYITKAECNYNCFLKLRHIDNYLDGVCFYIKSGSLIAYRPFIIHSILGEEKYYKNETFEFPITKSSQES